MPNKALTFCRWPGCNELTNQGFCEEHRIANEQKLADEQSQYNKKRGSASSQGYDSQWRRVRLAYLRLHPLCESCKDKGLIVPAELVHHIRAIKDGGKRLDPDNLRSLCQKCHEEIHGHDRWSRRKSR